MKRSLATICLIGLLILSFSQGRVPAANIRTTDYKEGESLYKKAEQLSDRTDFDETVQKMQDRLYREALSKFYRVSDQCGGTKNDSLCFHTFLKIALINHYFDSIDRAKENYLKVIELKKKLPQIADSFLFKPYLFLGGILYQQNQLDSASVFYQQAEQIQNRYAATLEGCQRLYNKEGALYYETGNYRLAKTYFEKALSLLSASDASYLPLMINYKINIASISVKLEQYEEAKKIYQSLLPYRIYENEIWHNLGIIDNYLGKFEEAIADLKKVRYPNNNKNIDLDYNLAVAFDNLHRSDSMMFYLQNAAIENKKLNGVKKNTPWGLVLKFWGDKYSQQKKYPEALRYYQQAIIQFDAAFNENDVRKNPEHFNGIFSYINLFNALSAKANAYQLIYFTGKKQEDLLSSLDAFRSAFTLADYVEKTYESDESRLFLNRIKYSAHTSPIEECIRLYGLTGEKRYLEEAYLFDQRNKASVLSLNLQLSGLGRQPGASTELIKKAGSLKSKITRLTLKGAQTSDSGQLSQVNNEISNDEIELGRLQRSLNGDPKYAQLQPAERIPSISLLQNRILDNHTGLLSYHLSENAVVVFIITSSTFTYYEHPINKDFYAEIGSYLKSLHEVGTGEKYNGDIFAKNLYQILVKPVLPSLRNCSRLIIVPDDELNYIPFESLTDEANHYLVDFFSVQYQYSTALLNINSKTTVKLIKGTLAFAPFTTDPGKGNFEYLKYSRDEVQGIEGKIFFDKAATKENFLAAANHYDIIHLATHARADDQFPMNSSIAFYPVGPDSSYRLYAQEVYGLNLDSTQLIILSACETGTGRLVRGEGLMSLSRAFAYAGCPNIVTSLWKAEDKTTAFITKRLHYYLKHHYSTDQALRRAKIDLFNSNEIEPRFKTPNYWAHLVFIGNYEAEYRNRLAWWIEAAIITIAISSVLYVKRKTWLK